MRRGSIELDAASLARFQKAMEELGSARKAYGTPAGMTKLLRNEMRLLVQRCIEFTPPQTGAGKGRAALQMGQQAIVKDVDNIVKGADGGYLERLAETFGKTHVRQQIRRKDGSVFLTDLDIIGLSEQELHTFHQSKRSKTTGRVSTAGQYTRDVGRWVAHDVMTVPRELLTAYLKKQFKHVGKAKSGWNHAARMFAVKSAGSWPSWVKRHPGKGGAKDTLKGNLDGFLEAANTERAIGSLNSKARIVQKAFNSRAREISLKAKRILDAAIKKANARK